VRVTFVGSGDAFGSGGRLQACLLVEAGGSRILVDCGTSVLIGLRRLGLDPNGIDAVVLSHLHGDHFGGVPFLVLDAQLVAKRRRPLVVAGPPGTARRVTEAMEVFFPGSSRVERRFALDVIDLEPDRPWTTGAFTVTPAVVEHASGAPPFALRAEAGGKVLAYTGDTAWTDTLVRVARGADLLVAEAYFADKRVPYHLDFRTLAAHLPEIGARRLIVTHMSADMLGRLHELPCESAADGLVVEV
jgi:ribonuclease BN (tRNA processing enzyme)